MGLPKGKTNNIHGRRAGVANRTTAEIRLLINSFISDNWQSVQTDFDKLEPKDRLQFFEKLMQYAIPKMQTISHDFEIDSTQPILIKFSEAQ